MNGLKKRKAAGQTGNALANKKAKARNPTPKSTRKPKARKSTSVDSLQWRKAKLPDMFDDAEGFYGLEEVDDVEIIRHSNNTIEFVCDTYTIWIL